MRKLTTADCLLEKLNRFEKISDRNQFRYIYMKKEFDLNSKIDSVLPEILFSEMTITELKFGIEKVSIVKKIKKLGQFFNWCSGIANLPFFRLVWEGKSTTVKVRNTSTAESLTFARKIIRRRRLKTFGHFATKF
ncbi:MAG: hypothetical protein ABIN48_11990 [Ginsengibacter sp.]